MYPHRQMPTLYLQSKIKSMARRSSEHAPRHVPVHERGTQKKVCLFKDIAAHVKMFLQRLLFPFYKERKLCLGLQFFQFHNKNFQRFFFLFKAQLENSELDDTERNMVK